MHSVRVRALAGSVLLASILLTDGSQLELVAQVGARSGFLRRVLIAGSLAALVGLVVTGGIGAQRATREGWKTFVSKRYHYSVAYPPGWKVTGSTQSARPHSFPSADDPTSDKFDSPGGSRSFRVAAQVLKPGTTLTAWTAAVIQNAKVRFQCALKSRSGRMIGGQNGTLLLYPSCYAYYFPLIVAVHHGLGFYVYWISFTGHEVVDRATFDKLASTLRFTS